MLMEGVFADVLVTVYVLVADGLHLTGFQRKVSDVSKILFSNVM